MKKLKTVASCLAQRKPRLCPDAKGEDKIRKAADKAATKIGSACAAGAALAGVGSAYSGFPGASQVASCSLSQHSATAKILAWTVNGAPGEIPSDLNRARCIEKLSKVGTKYLKKALAAMQECLLNELEDNPPPFASDFAATCVGAVSGGAIVMPTDTRAADTIGPAQSALLAAISDACGSLADPVGIDSIFGCAGAETLADLQDCLLCSHWNAAVDLIEQEFAENGSFVDPAGGGLQAAVNTASPGAKLLVGAGTYREQVVVTTDGLELVGCGAATGERPLVVPPAGPVPWRTTTFP